MEGKSSAVFAVPNEIGMPAAPQVYSDPAEDAELELSSDCADNAWSENEYGQLRIPSRLNCHFALRTLSL